MFSAKAIIRYRGAYDDKWVSAMLDQQLADYYLSLIPKSYRLTRPRWPAHATIARPDDYIKDGHWAWGRHEGEVVDFVYDPTLHTNDKYWWFNLWSKVMENIRSEFGLGLSSRITIPPHGYSKCFHCTVGMNMRKFE